MNDYHDIYDRVAKRCLTLSNRAVIHFINGRFHTDYPTDSRITYNWTEHADKDLKRTLADAILTVNGESSYQIEFQMSVDGSIVMRAFEYGFHHAQKNRKDENILIFPEPVIIYLYENQNVPDIQTLTVCFGGQGNFEYRVPTLKYQALPPQAMNRKDLILLLPFQLLKMRREIEKERTKENLEALKKLVAHDIIEAIKVNEEAGNITAEDGRVLKSLTLKLYHHIYNSFQEMETEGVNEIVEEALILDIDIINYRHAMELEASKKETEALRLLLKGASVEQAAEATGLAAEQIEKLRDGEN